MKAKAILVVVVLAMTGIAGRAAADMVFPSSARGGAIPIDFSGGPLAWAAPGLDTTLLTDTDVSTGITLFGLENVRNSSNDLADTGAFAVFEFQIPLDTPSFTFTIAASSHVVYDPAATYKSPGTLSIVAAVPASASYEGVYFSPTADIVDGLDYHTFTFSAEGHTGNRHTELTIADVMDSDGHVTFGVTGPFYQSPMLVYQLTGSPELHIREVWLDAVPEPASLSLLAFGGFALLRRRRCA